MGKVIDLNKIKRERMLDSAKKSLMAQGVDKEVATEVTSQFKMFSEYLSSECDVNIETNENDVKMSKDNIQFNVEDMEISPSMEEFIFNLFK